MSIHSIIIVYNIIVKSSIIGLILTIVYSVLIVKNTIISPDAK